MFIKKITKRNKETGAMYLTYRLVRSYKIDKKPRHETIIDMGTLSGIDLSLHKQLADRIEELLHDSPGVFDIPVDKDVDFYAHFFYNEILKRSRQPLRNTLTTSTHRNESSVSKTNATDDDAQNNLDENKVETDYQEVDVNSLNTMEASEIGGEWLCNQAFEEMGIQDIFLNKLHYSSKEYQHAIACLTGRLLYPGSDRKMALYLSENSGIHHLIDDAQRSKIVDRKSLVKMSQTLYSCKEQIENELNKNIQHQLQFEPKLLLYDLTNSHFEGRMQNSEKAKHGRNKQKRNDCRQVTLAMAVNEYGFAQYSTVFEGNIAEVLTLEALVKSISEKVKWSGTNKPVIVMDAGISSEENLIFLHQQGYDYISISKSEHRKYRDLIDPEQLHKIQTNGGETLEVQSFDHQLKYTIEQVSEDKNKSIKTKKFINERLLYVVSPPKKCKEDSILLKQKSRIEKELAALQLSITKPKTDKTAGTIYQRLGRIKERNRMIQSSYEITVTTENEMVTALSWDYHEKNKKEKDSGSYFIRSTLVGTDSQTLWKLYRTIGEIEDVFRTMKTDLLIRGIYHQIDKNIEAHIFVCQIAVMVVNYIRFKLKKKGINYRWSEIVRIMSTQKCVVNSIKTKHKGTLILKKCSRAGAKAREIYSALNYKTVPFFMKKYYPKNN